MNMMKKMKTSTTSSNSSKKMKMRGFMCQLPASTAVVCMTGADPGRSVIIPRKNTTTTTNANANYCEGIEHSQLLIHNHNNNNHKHMSTRYSRLLAAERRFTSSTSSTTLGSSTHNHHHHHKRSSSTSSSDFRDRGGSIMNPPSPPPPSSFQVVVMRVSLHCQGCAGKVKKHLSKMEGVTSFSIDLEMKRVTVMGHVSPVGVLESISKVKKAEFWTC